MHFKPYYVNAPDNRIHIYLDGYNSEDYLRFHLIFGSINKLEYLVDSLRPYNPLGSNDNEYAVLYTFMDDGDVFGNVYNLDNHNSFLQITHFDCIRNEVKGKFEMRFVIDTILEKIDPIIPDTFNIYNGEFHTRLVQ